MNGTSLGGTAERLIKDPTVGWDDKGNIWLAGTYAKSGGELVAYVTYFHAYSYDGIAGTLRKVISPTDNREPRIEIDRVERFDRDSKARIQLAIVTEVNSQWILQWGKASDRNISVGVSMAGYFGVVFLVDKNQSEDAYPFAVVGRKVDSSGNDPGPLWIGPNVFQALAAIRDRRQ